MSKGEETRERIVDHAWRLASRHGLAGLSLGRLAAELSLSKSGLFAHFRSKEDLELEVLKAASDRFVEFVVHPALGAPRGLPRLRKLFRNWLAWDSNPSIPGGCIFLAAASELDDTPGRQRDLLVEVQATFLATLAKSARLAALEGHLRRGVDSDLFAFQMLGIVMAHHHARRLLRDPKAETRARAAFDQLIASSSP